MKSLRMAALGAVAVLLGGCDMDVLNPSGNIAIRERNLILEATGLMLLIIVPVIVATLVFARRYRASNVDATYDPDWHHSTQLEVWIWTAPLLIIVALGAITWMGTHLLDPFRPLDKQLNKTMAKPLTVDVVALDWKWLFFYPEQGIASVNDLTVPAGRPINFNITSATVMNSFFIPAIAGQIYAMAGMQTKLSAMVDQPGTYNGLSSQYSGAGFSHMNFAVHGVSDQAFQDWASKAKSSGKPLDQKAYDALRKPSEEVPPTLYASFRPNLYEDILNMCATPGKMCQSEMMHIDAMGGGGTDSEANRKRLISDATGAAEGNEAPGATFPASDRPPNTITKEPQGMKPRGTAPDVNGQASPDTGQGQLMPGAPNTSPAPAQLNQH